MQTSMTKHECLLSIVPQSYILIVTYSVTLCNITSLLKAGFGGLATPCILCTDATQPSKSETIIIVHITTLIIISVM